MLLQNQQEDEISDTFVQYFMDALQEVMKGERDRNLVFTRFGFVDGKYYTLQSLGDINRISRERVRQILTKSLRRIRETGKKQIIRGNNEHPCALLMNLLNRWVMPNDASGQMNIALLALRLSSLPTIHMALLITELCYEKDELINEKKQTVKKLLSGFSKSVNDFHANNRWQMKKFDLIFSNAAWPDKMKHITLDEFSQIQPKREVNFDTEGTSGVLFSEKNKRDIQYESNLEFQFCMYLEKLDDVIGYIGQPFRVPYIFNGVTQNYYPDFAVLLKGGRCVVVEIKTRADMGLFINLQKWMGLQAFCEQNGYGYLVFEKSNSINDYIFANINQEKKATLVRLVQDRDLYYGHFKLIRKQYSISWFEFVSIVIQENLHWSLEPFQLTISDGAFNQFISRHKAWVSSKQKERQPSKIESESANALMKTVEQGQFINAGKYWPKSDDFLLLEKAASGSTINELSIYFGRTPIAIQARLEKLAYVPNNRSIEVDLLPF